MSTTDLSGLSGDSVAVSSYERKTKESLSSVHLLLTFFASLRLTVSLFFLSIFLVWAGTLAQRYYDIWHVIHDYFRCWVAFIEIKIFFPESWFTTEAKFPFPGGWLIGAFLSLNLFAAHSVRFKVSASGNKLWVGLGLIAVGILLTYLVILSGLGNSVESELSPRFCEGLWAGLRFFLGMLSLGFAYGLVLLYPVALKSRLLWFWWLGAIACLLMLALTVYLFFNNETKLDPSGLRVLWQLMKATSAGVVLFGGCQLVFGKRAGVVLLHGGIALLMINELVAGIHADEAHMRLLEGQTLSYAEDNREVELAVVDKSDPLEDVVTTIPAWALQEAFESGKPYTHPALPFQLEIVEFLENAQMRFAQPGEKPKATAGFGRIKVVEPQETSKGVDQKQSVDVPAAFVRFAASPDAKSSGVYLFSPAFFAEPVDIGEKTYEIELRFRRIHKDYSITLVDFERNTYVGTATPKNFESVVQLDDPANNVSRKLKIWMNNPLRYGGDTLYQSSYDPNNERYTDLQVVSNSGWMIPYVACMIVLFGMLAHFALTLYRFILRQDREEKKISTEQEAKEFEWGSLFQQVTRPAFLVPSLVLMVFVLYVGGKARPAKEPADQMQIHAFGKLPIAQGGRVQPMDSYARSTLQYLSTLTEFEDKSGDMQPAIRWFLDTVAQAEGWRDHRVFRIENLDVLQILDLKPRSGLRYSFSEISKNAEEFFRQADLASQAAKEAERSGNPLSLAQVKTLELKSKLNVTLTLLDTFSPLVLSGTTEEELVRSVQEAKGKIAYLDKVGARPIPPIVPGEPWQTVMGSSENYVKLAKLVWNIPAEENKATQTMLKMLEAYRKEDVLKFSAELSDYQTLIAERADEEAKYDEQLGGESMLKPAERLNLDRIGFEAYFNHLRPFYLAMVLYVFAFILVALSWLGYRPILNRSAHWLLWFTFAFHTFALVCRVYISGRPPVTNLYSSAVFIGWAAVLFALLFEKVYRFGIGNLLATLIGFPTLFIAHNLAGDGDTFAVMQAVLDTQFWLATHVVTISLGYATTFVAGTLGMVYIIADHLLGILNDRLRKQLMGMIYGILCFATLFSLIGTVLGGLWADDSWGRFWGWDPKENGALMIVLWNALVLHARWGAMVKYRGMAVLAVCGNVVTAWSWFGVNQLGVGLHSYGATEGRWQILFAYFGSQLLIMGLGCLPQDVFRGDSENEIKAT